MWHTIQKIHHHKLLLIFLFFKSHIKYINVQISLIDFLAFIILLLLFVFVPSKLIIFQFS
jgi:hypothetical protein